MILEGAVDGWCTHKRQRQRLGGRVRLRGAGSGQRGGLTRREVGLTWTWGTARGRVAGGTADSTHTAVPMFTELNTVQFN